jgi:hypothetical protein
MRPARFFLALLFGAAVLITFLKLLFFAAIAAVVFGGIYFLFQGVRHTAIGKNWGQAPFVPDQQFPMNRIPQNTIQPFGMGKFPATPQQTFPRHIEVL